MLTEQQKKNLEEVAESFENSGDTDSAATIRKLIDRDEYSRTFTDSAGDALEIEFDRDIRSSINISVYQGGEYEMQLVYYEKEAREMVAFLNELIAKFD